MTQCSHNLNTLIGEVHRAAPIGCAWQKPSWLVKVSGVSKTFALTRMFCCRAPYGLE